MQQFDITVPSQGAFPVHAAGRYIKYVAGNNGGGDTSLVVTPGAAGGSRITLQVGQAYRIADNKPTPDSWVLQNATGGAPILGKVVIGDGRIDDNSIAGTVQVVDGGKARTLGNTAYGAGGANAPAAGQYGRVQLWNPATNPNRLVVEAVTLFSSATANVGILTSNAKLGVAGSLGQPKRLDGVQSVAGIATDSTAAPGNAAQIASYGIVANSMQTLKLNEPVVVPPGYGLMLLANVANSQVQANFEWYEEPNV